VSRRWCPFWLWLTAACGSVTVPQEHFYRLDWPEPSGGQLPRLGVLRVLDLEAASHLQGDGPALAVGAVRLHRDELHRWVAPLDRMVTEALLQGLARTRMFALVKGAGDGGTEDLTLDGRILAFEQVVDGAGRRARVALEIWVERDGRRGLRSELRAEEACRDAGPEAAVRALSLALAQVVDQLAGELRGLAAEERVDAGPGR
jgi:uncharacterized lipoprotein YmbA